MSVAPRKPRKSRTHLARGEGRVALGNDALAGEPALHVVLEPHQVRLAGILFFARTPRRGGEGVECQPRWRFHVFVPAAAMPEEAALATLPGNVSVYLTGDVRFYEVLQRCAGIVTTAGHSLLSEAMHLRKPVYALPLPVYEQEMNAHVIDVNNFGIGRHSLTEPQLAEFLGGLPDFAANIRKDKTVLLRGTGEDRIIRYLESKLA